MIKPSPSPITISFGAVGAVVSTVAVSVTGDDVLPAGSLIETSTSSAWPSGGTVTGTVICPAVKSSAVIVCSSPLTITLSPTETPVSGKTTTTSTLPFVISSGVIKPSPSPITTLSGEFGGVLSFFPPPLPPLSLAAAIIPPATNGTAHSQGLKPASW